MASFTLPFRRTFRYLQIQAHENPVIFYSVIIGSIGPIMALTVPPIRAKMGYKKAPEIPQTYPLPQRARTPTVGYEDP